ncbi:motility associated factor glycosyltransferase family protein [Rossellomorea sp. LjRoot5]|uniref:motility associated factor glycosyltransferase family protein n=1 Tax=Rossellomorea sp. LjRoot5 TaxID=3342331 RepID=UPI003ECEAADA
MHLNIDRTQLINEEVSSKVKTFFSKEGMPVYEIKGYLTTSKYRPKIEAEKISQENYRKNNCHILLGIGSGNIANELHSLLSNKEKLLIIEPNKNILEKMENLKCLLDTEKVKIISGLHNEELEKVLYSLVKEYNNRIQLIISPNYDKIYPNFTKKAMVKIKEILMLETVNRNTLSRFAENWQENFIRNFYFAFQSKPLNTLAGKLNCPVVIASGGPSLDKHLLLIKKNLNKFFLLCAGSTLNTLLDNGIVPDGIVSIDGGLENYNHFKNLKDFTIPLFYSMTLNTEILKLHSGEKIIFNSKGHDQSNQIVDELLKYKVGEVIGGGSVANFTLDIANKLTNGPVCLIGQDLAYTDNASHAIGNINFSKIDKVKMNERKMFEIDGYHGDKVLTDYPFFSMKRGFELYLNYLNHSREVYNCTEGGAFINGCVNTPFKSFINEFCKEKISKEFLQLFSSENYIKTNENWEKLYEIMNGEKEKCQQAQALCTVALDILLKLNPQKPIFNIKTNKKLEKSDKKLKLLLNSGLLFYLFGEVIHSVNNNFLEKESETFEMNQKRIYLKSLALYEGIQISLQKAIHYYQELLNDISQELIKGE